ncbi:hypothetical protein V6N13_044396 [Hibiscus sabdariffa]
MDNAAAIIVLYRTWSPVLDVTGFQHVAIRCWNHGYYISFTHNSQLPSCTARSSFNKPSMGWLIGMAFTFYLQLPDRVPLALSDRTKFSLEP